MRIVNKSLALSVNCHMDDCLAGMRALLRDFFDLARFGRELDGSRAWAGNNGSFIDVFVGDLMDLTEPWLRRCDFLRTGADADGFLGFGNLAKSRSDSFPLLTVWLSPDDSPTWGLRGWASCGEAVLLAPTGVSGGGVTVMASGDVGWLASAVAGVDGPVDGEVSGISRAISDC